MASRPSEHLVILVHGIRDHAFWYDRLKRLFEANRGIYVEGAKYGRLDLFRFLAPGPWRRTPIEKIKEKIRPLVVEANRLGRKITVIAHSNGTQVVTSILREDPLFRIDNLIMCGSVVDDDYDWWLVKERVRGLIVNDYGVRDPWPAVARSVTWGYGYSGTVGFGAPVVDRIHDGGHSDYFTDDFMRTYWLPLVRDAELADSPPLATDSGGRPWWFDVFELPLRWIWPAALLAAGVFVFLHHEPARPGRPPQVAQPYSVLQASYLASDHWQPVDLYQGPARNMLRESDLKVVGGGGSPASFDPTDADTTDADQTPEAALAREVGGVLARYGLTSHDGRTQLRRCMSAAKALAACPGKVQAAALDLLHFAGFGEEPPLDQLDQDLGSFAGRTALLTAPADQGQEMLTRVRITVRNRSPEDRLLTGMRFRLRKLFYAGGDGSVQEQPIALEAQPAGTIQLRRLFLADCARPAQPPTIEIVLPGPLPIKAGGSNHIELKVDTGSRRLAAADAVEFFGTDEHETPSVAGRCTEMRANQAKALTDYPRFAGGLRLVRVPMFDSDANSAVEVAFKDDRGVWSVVGTMNFALP